MTREILEDYSDKARGYNGIVKLGGEDPANVISQDFIALKIWRDTEVLSTSSHVRNRGGVEEMTGNTTVSMSF